MSHGWAFVSNVHSVLPYSMNKLKEEIPHIFNEHLLYTRHWGYDGREEFWPSWNLQPSPSTSPRLVPTLTSELISPSGSGPTWPHVEPASLKLAPAVGCGYRVGSAASLPGFNIWLCCLLAVSPWKNYFSSLGSSFLILEMKVIAEASLEHYRPHLPYMH